MDKDFCCVFLVLKRSNFAPANADVLDQVAYKQKVCVTFLVGRSEALMACSVSSLLFE